MRLRGRAWVKPTGFIEIQRKKQPYRPVAERLHDWREVYLPYGEGGPARAGVALHGLRDPVLSSGLPTRQPDSGLERFRLSRPVGGGDRPAARDEQLSRVDGPPVPRAVRGIVRARHQRLAVTIKAVEVTIIERAFDEGWVVARPPADADRQARRRRRFRASRPGRRRPAESRGPLGDRLRARRSHRRPAALRHPGIQAREEVPRTPAGR